MKKINDIIHCEIVSIDNPIIKMVEIGTDRTIYQFFDMENVEVGDIVVVKVVEVGTKYDDQETYGLNIIEILKKNI